MKASLASAAVAAAMLACAAPVAAQSTDGYHSLQVFPVVVDTASFAQQFNFTTPNLFPGVSISADLGNGPGIQEVATFSVDVAGENGGVAVSNAHGTVTGAAGGVPLRPFARLISSAGDSVTTYGEPWNMN